MSDKTLCINCGKLVLGPRVQNESTSAGRAKQHTFGCLTVVLFHPCLVRLPLVWCPSGCRKEDLEEANVLVCSSLKATCFSLQILTCESRPVAWQVCTVQGFNSHMSREPQLLSSICKDVQPSPPVSFKPCCGI